MILGRSTGGNFSPIPDGVYPAFLESVEMLAPETNQWNKPQLKWVFFLGEIEDEGGEVREVRLSRKTGVNIHPKAEPLCDILRAVGAPIDDPEAEIDPDDYVGQRVKLMVSQDPPAADGRVWNKVVSVRPMNSKVAAKMGGKATNAKPAPAPAPVAAAADFDNPDIPF